MNNASGCRDGSTYVPSPTCVTTVARSACAAFLVVNPPLGLLPSLAGLQVARQIPVAALAPTAADAQQEKLKAAMRELLAARDAGHAQ